MGKAIGLFRVYYLVALCCVGSFLFAYDTGVVGGVLTLASFKDDFHYTTKEQVDVAANSTSLLQAGAFFACFFAWPFTARFGRRWSLMLASIIFCIGAILQTINTHSIPCFYVARVISGIGVGMATVIIPMFSAEMAPKYLRGSLGAMFQFMFTCGVMTFYWIDYAVAQHMSSITAQWQIPVGLQLAPGAVLELGMLLCKESTRWLAKAGRREEGLQSLIWVRGGEDTQKVREEYAEILAGIEEEDRITEGFTWKEMLLPMNRRRMLITIALQIGVQITGNTSLAYFAPQIFKAVGAGDNSLLISGFFGLVKVIACGFFVLFLAERLGHRWSLLLGAAIMGIYMLTIGILTQQFPPVADAGFTSSAAASITLVYLEAMTYNTSWGPVPWISLFKISGWDCDETDIFQIWMAEIWPSRIREAGIGIGTAMQWLFNFVFSHFTPHAVNNLGWRVFLMFAILTSFWSSSFGSSSRRQTKGLSIEQMDALFVSPETATSAEQVHAKMENDVDHKESADATVAEARA